MSDDEFDIDDNYDIAGDDNANHDDDSPPIVAHAVAVTHPYQRELSEINNTFGNLTDANSLAQFFAFVNQQYLNDNFNSNWYLAGINYLLGQMRRPMNDEYTLNTLIEVTRLLVLASIRDLSLEDLTYYLNSFTATVEQMIRNTANPLPIETIQHLDSVTQAFENEIRMVTWRQQQQEQQQQEQQSDMAMNQQQEQDMAMDIEQIEGHLRQSGSENNTQLQEELETKQQRLQELQHQIQQQQTKLQQQGEQLQQQGAQLQQQAGQLQALNDLLAEMEQDAAANNAPPAPMPDTPYSHRAETYNRQNGNNPRAWAQLIMMRGPNNDIWAQECARELAAITPATNDTQYLNITDRVLNFFQPSVADTISCDKGVRRITNANIQFQIATNQSRTTLFIQAIRTGRLILVQSIYNILSFAPNVSVDVNARDGDERTPLDIAISYRYKDIIDWLRSIGARSTSNQSDSQSVKRGKNANGDATGIWSNNGNSNNSSSSSSGTGFGWRLFSSNSGNNSIQMCQQSDRSCLDRIRGSSSNSREDRQASLGVQLEPAIMGSNSSSGTKRRAQEQNTASGNPDGEPGGSSTVLDLNDEDSCARFLGYRNFDDIPDNEAAFTDNVQRLIRDAGGNGQLIQQIQRAAAVCRQKFEGGGGKRRTMKVKKQFRKTNKRVYKKGKKTRVRRNNKSKRVLKEKRRR